MQTKEEYFELIRSWGYDWPGPEGSPVEWAREAWDLEEVQESQVYSLAREVSKGGSLACTPEFLALCSAILTDLQVRRLYLQIRARSPHREEEFRPEFLAAFAQHSHAIPSALTRDDITARLGMTAEEAARYWQEVDHPPWLNQPNTSQPIESDDDIPF
ncbi:MAG: hypothetical protein U0792_19315 [Gemmataceae bacterium]